LGVAFAGVAFAGVAFLGVALGVESAGFFTFTGSDRFGLFLLAKNADVVVSSSSGEGSRFTFFGGGFFGLAAFLGLFTVSFTQYQVSSVISLGLKLVVIVGILDHPTGSPCLLGSCFFGRWLLNSSVSSNA